MIIIVDNDCAVRESLRLLFDCVGLEARGFPSSEAFLDAAPPVDKECLVLDMHMPGMSGIELLEELRQRGDEVPVIIVTGLPSVTSAARAKAAGALAVVEKPFKPSEILALVRTALEKKPGALPMPTTTQE
jgi:two-component system, LuxR family, response regulator FixJ